MISVRSGEAVRAFDRRRVLVVGDVMLDEYLRGDASRISPEAPVPVVDVRERSYAPGGAANTAANVGAMGGVVTVFGVVGDDPAGHVLRRLIEERSIGATGLVVDPTRVTSSKTRIVACSQQLVRFDSECRLPISASVSRELLQRIEVGLQRADACVVSDYAKGVVTPDLCRAVIRLARNRGVPVVVDPKSADFGRYAGATLVTPNTHELEMAAKRSLATEAEVVEAGQALLGVLEGGALLVTRGADGMSLLRPSAQPLHVPTAAKHVYDVTGAGDTVVSTFALGVAAAVPFDVLLHVANLAAGLAVSRLGTVAVTAAELLAAMGEPSA